LAIELFNSEKVELHLNKKNLEERFEKIAFFEHYKIKLINIVFITDKTIILLNNRFLNHNYPTDVIAFDYCHSIFIEGDVFISVDSVRLNSKLYNNNFKSELYRVMIHGILHLLKYDDKKEKDIKVIRKKEQYYLRLFENI
jgi:probable rRNA maturation factor